MSWYESATIFYDWARYGEDLGPEYAGHVVRKTLDCHCDTLAFCVQIGGYALWDSGVTPRYPRIGQMDLIAELARLCREHGLHFVPWWLATVTGGVNRVIRENPSWQLLGPPVDGGPQVKHNYVCYNSPYRDLLYAEVREVLAKYEVDGVYFDQLPGSCYCEWCRAKFSERHGQPMPVVADEFFVYNSAAGLPPLLREFRDESVRSFCAGIRHIIDEVRPGTCYAQNWVRNQQAYLALGYADVLLPEFYQRDDLVPLGLRHRLTKTYFDHGPIWGNVRHSVRHDARHNPVRGTRMLLFDCLANHASPLMLDLCAMDFDSSGIEELAETFDDIRAAQETLAGAEPVRYAALLHSRRSHELHRDRYDEAFEGMYRLLFEAHVPFEILNEAGVQRGELEDYEVLVIPDGVNLCDETIAGVQEAVNKGVGLVATYMTGFEDENGNQRARPALADLFGIEMEQVVLHDKDKGVRLDGIPEDHLDSPTFPYGSARESHSLAEGLPDGGRFAFYGGFVACRASSDVEVLADIHGPDTVRLKARTYNRLGLFPGPARWPLALTRQRGRARVACFACQADATWRRAHAPELESLMLRSILWAGGQSPLEAQDCPSSVEVRLFHNPERRLYQIILVNLTTNPLVRAGGNPGVIRYVTPQKGLRFVLHADVDVRTVRSLIGADVKCRVEDGRALLELAVLDLYDSILVEYD